MHVPETRTRERPVVEHRVGEVDKRRSIKNRSREFGDCRCMYHVGLLHLAVPENAKRWVTQAISRESGFDLVYVIRL